MGPSRGDFRLQVAGSARGNSVSQGRFAFLEIKRLGDFWRFGNMKRGLCASRFIARERCSWVPPTETFAFNWWVQPEAYLLLRSATRSQKWLGDFRRSGNTRSADKSRNRSLKRCSTACVNGCGGGKNRIVCSLPVVLAVRSS